MRTFRSLCCLVLAGAFSVGCSEFSTLPTEAPDDPNLPRPALTPSQQTQLTTPAPPTPAGPVAPRFSHLSAPGATVIDFEGFGCFTSITNQFAGLGVTFSSATILTLPPCLNPSFPPHSGTGVIFDFPTGIITANFSVPVVRAGGYVTGNRVITLECFDAANASLGTTATPGPNFIGAGTPNIFLEIVSPGITRCEFRDGGNSYTVDDFAFLALIEVEIDIKPGGDPNSIHCNNEKGVISVAILTTPDFDATTVDHTTVTFEGASETHVDKRTGQPRRHEEDVDGDGDTDLVFHFRYGDTGLTCASTEGTLSGETFDGIPIEGSDAVNMVDRGFIPVPIAPKAGDLIPQNLANIGCPFHATRGYGFQIVFDWVDSRAKSGIAGYEIFAKHEGAIFPIVDLFVTTSEHTLTSCNAFVADPNLEDWRWRVRARDNEGNLSEWSPMANFAFEPCRLSDGRACFAS